MLYCTVSPRFSWHENHLNKTREAWTSHVHTQDFREQSTVPLSHDVNTDTDLDRGKGEEGEGRWHFIIPIPREATSVATMTGLFPVLNSFKTQSRSFCCLSPWIAVENCQSVIWKVCWTGKKITYRVLAIHPGGGNE